MYHKKLELTFLTWILVTSNGKILTKLYDKRDDFSFLLCVCQAFIAKFHHLS